MIFFKKRKIQKQSQQTFFNDTKVCQKKREQLQERLNIKIERKNPFRTEGIGNEE